MIDKLAEDRIVRHRPRRARRRLLRMAFIAAAFGVAWLTVPAVVPGQTADEPLRADLRNMGADSQPLVIPIGKSVIVDSAEPVTRLQSISGSIVFAESVSPTQFLLSGVGYGSTQVIAWSEDGKQRIFHVRVELDLQSLIKTLKKIDPQSHVEAMSVMGNIVLTGTVSGPLMADRMVRVAELFLPTDADGNPQGEVQNYLQVSGEQQVLLRCTVAEVNKNAARTLGINGFLAGEDFRDAFVVNQLGGINPINIGAAADTNIRGDIPFLTGTEGIPISGMTTLSLGFPRAGLQVFMRAMVDNSLLRILAEPNLVAVSGETASFLAGGEFPIPVPQATAGGAATITIEFREFGVRLNFRPTVLAGQRVRLRVAPEVSELNFDTSVQSGGVAVPGLTQRRAVTTVEVGNGQTIVLAGLLNETIRARVSKVPGIGDVPVLGALFRSVEYRKDKTELVILVTPEIVAPLNPQQVDPVPGEFLQEPNDYELYALGLLEGGTTAEGTPTDGFTHAADADAVPSEPNEMSIHGPWGPATNRDVQQ